jgi:geranylgeranyl diphosphate synthase type I
MTPDLTFVAGQLRPYLADLLAAEQADWKELGAPWADAVEALAGFVERGKALRPRFCYWGHAATGAIPGTAAGQPRGPLLPACAALELLHAFALIHDDLMDGSPTRRGRPALHRRLAGDHRRQRWAGDPGQYGSATAMLAGDLAFALAGRLAAELPRSTGPVWNRLIQELTAGQFLDLAGAARRDRSVELARTVARLKSGRYTVTGPLRLGAALVSDAPLDPALAQFGELVGEAFQLRDDLHGVFGDPDAIGKPVGEDLRAGKPTLLLALADRHLPPHRRALVARAGAADLTDAEVAALTAAIEECGARARVEHRIARHLHAARDLIDGIALPVPVRDALGGLAAAAAG